MSAAQSPKREENRLYRSPAAAGQKRIYSLSCLFCCMCVLEKYISFLSFSIYLRRTGLHSTYVMGDKHFPWRPVYRLCVSDDALYVLFVCCLEYSVDQENPASTRLCTYFQESFFLVVHRSVNTIGQAAHQRPQRRQCRLFFFDKVFWWWAFFFFFPCLCHSLFLPFSASLNEIPPYYNSIQLDWNTANERLLLLCTCRRCDTWIRAPPDGLFISMYRIDTRMYSDLFGLIRETVRRRLHMMPIYAESNVAGDCQAMPK